MQTGALGDVEIVIHDESMPHTVYEMKTRRVSRDDIDIAVQKLATSGKKTRQYLFITTEPIESSVAEYARSKYDSTGIEFAILDCIGFARHFLHFFHQFRLDFIEAYRKLVLAEPDSAIKHPLKEAFLSLLHSALADQGE